MKRVLFPTLGCVIALAATSLLAQRTTGQVRPLSPPGETRRSARSQPVRPPAQSTLLRVLDSDHDGVLDAEEIADATEALEGLDADGDGRLIRGEYEFGSVTAPRRRPSAGARSAVRPVPIPRGGLENFGFVDDRLFRGARPGPQGIETLKRLGVSVIVDLTMPDVVGAAEKAEAERHGLIYVNTPMESLARPAEEQVAAILSTITNAPGKVFVHCRAGKDRTGLIVACYRMAHCQWTREQALQEADQFRMVPEAVRMKEFVIDFGQTRVASRR